jgi:hypothetical protein
MRRWIIGVSIFVFGAFFAANLPALYARVKLDRSFPALSRYEFERTPDTVLIGSSMTFRLYEGYFARMPVRNLAISGGSPLTGLAIIASYKSLPNLILVETNIMSRELDSSLVEQFGSNEAEPFKWFRPFRALISAIYYQIKYQSQTENVERLPLMEPTDYDISASVSAVLKDYGSTGYDEAMKRNTDELKRLVSNLKARGCKIIFYELPYPKPLGDAHFAVTARALTTEAFPQDKWLVLNSIDQLRWMDGAHMDERSAILVAQEIERQLVK